MELNDAVLHLENLTSLQGVRPTGNDEIKVFRKTATKNDQPYDIAIIGSGIASSTLACVLAKQGLRVVMIEAKKHPRFAIGESLILEASEMMRSIAAYFDVPEIAQFSSEYHFPDIGTTHGVKRHFGFLHHQEGKVQNPADTLQAVIPKHPHGHELHLFRQDSDLRLVELAKSLGVKLLENTLVQALDFTDEGVEVQLPDGGLIEVGFVVDATGYNSIVSKKFNLRTTEGLQTHSRALFTHMVDVPPLSEVEPGADDDLPFKMEEGTIHHVFDGGWIWVIPFNNHKNSSNPVTSVGLMLDSRKYPVPEHLTPEEEFQHWIEKFPQVHAHLRKGKAIRKWTRTPGRIQYSSKQVVGDRWVLLGHAAGFIDPLFSKGLYFSLRSVFTFAHLFLQAHKTQDYSRAHFLPLEDHTFACIRNFDHLIAGCYASFKAPALWRKTQVLWLLGAYTEFLKLMTVRMRSRKSRAGYFEDFREMKLVGGGFSDYWDFAEDIYAQLRGVEGKTETELEAVLGEMQRRFETEPWIEPRFRAILEGAKCLPKNKFRFELVKPLFVKSRYRKHFFGGAGVLRIGVFVVGEFLRYSRVGLGVRRWFGGRV